MLSGLVPVLLVLVLQSCDATRHLPEGTYLLRSNKVTLKTPSYVDEKATLSDNLTALIAQKPNKRLLGIPVQLYLYNLRSQKYTQDTTNYQLQSGTVEKPVILDSNLTARTVQNMQAFLFNSGFFYAQVRDTVKLKARKALVTYEVATGPNYLLRETMYDVDDSLIRQQLLSGIDQTLLKKGQPFTMLLLDEERARLTAQMQNLGYYRFSNENISFKIDTLDPGVLQSLSDPFSALASVDSVQPAAARKTLSVRVLVRNSADSNAYNVYKIGRIRVYPDFADRSDYRNTTMIEKQLGDITFRYHKYWLREEVIFRNIFFETGARYSQDDYDRTVTRLNDLGVFQYVRIALNDDTTNPDDHVLRCTIYMNPTPRYDFNANFEVSSASTYTLGSAVSFGIRNRNLFKGANQLSFTASTGIELIYDDALGEKLSDKFFTRSRNVGANVSLNMPRFLVPFPIRKATKSNLPRTIIGLGSTLLDRTDYFTLINTTASLTYNWRQSPTKTWELSPMFVSVFRLPYTSPDFQARLDTNTFLANSYREVSIVGESLTYTFSNNDQKRGRNYTYLRLAAEEAGGLLFDADLRHFWSLGRKVLAMRLATGVGLPYGNNTSLPYPKQYFAGGAYSVRGWRVRTLGPGSYYNPADVDRIYFIDRTGDIRIEGSAELRFDLFRLFGGGIKFSGATFADAGNVWLAQPNSSYPGGEFRFSKLWHDLAVSTGVGVRLNFSDFIILRVDGAVPVKKPYQDANGGWTFGDIRLGDSDWRSNNLILNFAIGYPF
jgi:outer membrane protein assembly factor BamA